MGELTSLPRLLDRNATRFASRPAYREKELGIWQSWTWAETAEEVEALALGLLGIGVEAGDHVAIVGRNRPHFYWSMVAAQCVGAVPVPVYQDSVAEEIIIYVDPRGLRKYDHTRMTSFAKVQADGRAADKARRSALAGRRDVAGYDDTCVMLYTSGTTGRPKGVVLSNRNIIETSKASAAFDKLTEDESILAYLPMAWVGDFIFSVGQAYWCGFCTNCPESTTTMYENLHEIGPTYFFAPPRYFEERITILSIRMEDAGALKRRMYQRFMKLAARVGRSHWARDFRILAVAGYKSETAVWADRSGGVYHPTTRQRSARGHRWCAVAGG